jgi:hypothetical protein
VGVPRLLATKISYLAKSTPLGNLSLRFATTALKTKAAGGVLLHRQPLIRLALGGS